MNEMRERVARALAHAAGGKMIGPGRCRAMQEFGWHGDGKHLELYAEAHWKDFENDAGFALSAMRLPTLAMLRAACAKAAEEQVRPVAIRLTDAEQMFTAMIDEALK